MAKESAHGGSADAKAAGNFAFAEALTGKRPDPRRVLRYRGWLQIASRIDAKVQRLVHECNDDVASFVEMADDRAGFKRLLDVAQCASDELCLRFSGFYHDAKSLETIAAGIESAAIKVPR